MLVSPPHDTRPLPTFPSSHACLSDVFRAQLRQGVTAGQHPVDLEIRIALDAIALVVEIRQHGVHEVSLLLDATGGLELGQPDRTSTGHGLGILDMLLEGVDTVLIGIAVPVDGDEIDLAARARGHEFRQPVETRCAAAVAHGRRADLDLVAEFLHVVPGGGGFFGGHVGLGAEVGLVETEDVGRAVGDGLLDVGLPVREVV